MQSLKIASLVTPVWERTLIFVNAYKQSANRQRAEKGKKGMIVIFHFFKKGDVLNKTDLNKGKNANKTNIGTARTRF